jgi:DNA-binding NarL/FixJ family response regulator
MEEIFIKAQLSMREIRILRLVKAGLKNKVIAEELKIQISTVKCHKRSLMRKLGLYGKRALKDFLVSHSSS